MQSLVSLAVSIGVLLAAAGIGRGLRVLVAGTGSCAKDEAHGSVQRQTTEWAAGERVIVDASLGLGVVSLVIFACCSLQLLRFGSGLAIAAVTAAASLPGLVSVLRDIRAILGRAMRPSGVFPFCVAVLLIVIGVATLIPALAPPSMDDWDSLAYHLAVPKLFIKHGGFYYIHFTTHSNFPFLVEMLYIPGLALGDPVASKLMHFWVGVLLVAAVVVLTRKHVKPDAAPLAALAIAGMPIVLWEATTAYVDLATALYTIVALHLMMNYLDPVKDGRGGREPLILCGLAVGFAASTKMIGLKLIPMLAFWLLVVLKASRWRSAAAFTAAAVAACLPWYVKSIIYTGNPVYPFFYSIFGGRDWSVELARNYAALQAQFGLGHGSGSFLMLPYNIAFRSEAFYDRPGLYVGPMVVVSLPVMAFARYRSHKLVGLALFFIVQMTVWFLLSQQSRYLIPAMSVLAVVSAGLVHTDERFRLTKPVLAAVFTASALFGLFVQILPQTLAALPVAIGVESRSDYLERRLDIYQAQQFINKELPSDAKIALFGDTRGFYLDRDYAWADWGHNKMFSRNFACGSKLAEYLKKNGFNYAMVNFGVAFPKPKDAKGTAKAVYQAIETGDFQEVYPGWGSGSVAVYEIR